MGKVFKILGITLLLLIIVFACIPFMFKGKLLDITKSEINKSVNAKVEFKDFDLSIFSSFPDLKLSLEGVTVAGINEFAGDTLLKLDEFSANIDLMSVMSGSNIKIKTIYLKDLGVTAKVLSNGKANWDISKSTDTTSSTEKSNFKLALQSLEIENGRILYDDKSLSTKTLIENMNLLLEGDFTADMTTIKSSFSIDSLTADYDGITYLKKAKIVYNGGIEADMKNFKFTFKDNNIKANALDFAINGWLAMPQDDINMDLSFNAKQAEFKSFFSLIPGVFLEGFETIKTSGTLAFNGKIKGTYNSETGKNPAFNLNLLIKDAMFKYPEVPKPVTNIQVDLQINNPDGDLDKTVIDLRKLHAEFAENPCDVVMNVSTPMSDPAMKCKISGKIDLDKMKEFIPLTKTTLSGLISTNIEMEGRLSQIEKEQYQDFKANGTLNISNLQYTSADFPQGMLIKTTDIEFSPRYVLLKNFDSKIGKSDIQMNGRLENFIPYVLSNDTISGSLQISSTLFDANELLSIDTTATTTDTASSALSIIEVPGNINFEMQSNFGRILYDKLDIKNTRGRLVIKDSKVDLSNLSMNLLGGSLSMNGFYTTQDITKPAFDFKMDVRNFDVQQTYSAFNTIKKMAPFAKNCSGVFSCNLNINSNLGKDMMPIYNTLNGEGKLSTREIIVKGASSINKVADLLKREDLKELKTKNVDMQFTITNGNIEVKPFTTKLNDNTATISGTNNLDKTINYKIAMQVPRSNIGGAANSAIDGLLSSASAKGITVNPGQNINVDILIGGTIDDPKPSLSLGSTTSSIASSVKDQAKAKLEEERAKLEQKAKEETAKIQAEAERKAKEEAEKVKQSAQQKAKEEAKKKLNTLFK